VRVAQGDEVVLALLILEDGAFADPAAGAAPGEGYGLAVRRDGADLEQAADDADPVVELVAAMADVAAGREPPLGDALQCAGSLGLGERIGPEGDFSKLGNRAHVPHRVRPPAV